MTFASSFIFSFSLFPFHKYDEWKLTVSKARHRGDILEFTIKNNEHLSISGVTFNLFVRGGDWLEDENEPNLLSRGPASASNGGADSDGIIGATVNEGNYH